jgi:hypothetical protein
MYTGLAGFLNKIVVINSVLTSLLAVTSYSGVLRMDNKFKSYRSPPANE